ncbi:Arf-Gap With Sh3 Domain, Ank Repeat And Ph Domain-Containing Protein 1 [Manis pentadactyla]|nr:Arf-Gap With Sh3 Domain, Ank Repeat And Ph Domain-Containing Protein 1 [Manis pentadactyla]
MSRRVSTCTYHLKRIEMSSLVCGTVGDLCRKHLGKMETQKRPKPPSSTQAVGPMHPRGDGTAVLTTHSVQIGSWNAGALIYALLCLQRLEEYMYIVRVCSRNVLKKVKTGSRQAYGAPAAGRCAARLRKVIVNGERVTSAPNVNNVAIESVGVPGRARAARRGANSAEPPPPPEQQQRPRTPGPRPHPRQRERPPPPASPACPPAAAGPSPSPRPALDPSPPPPRHTRGSGEELPCDARPLRELSVTPESPTAPAAGRGCALGRRGEEEAAKDAKFSGEYSCLLWEERFIGTRRNSRSCLIVTCLIPHSSSCSMNKGLGMHGQRVQFQPSDSEHAGTFVLGEKRNGAPLPAATLELRS